MLWRCVVEGKNVDVESKVKLRFPAPLKLAPRIEVSSTASS